VGYPLIIAKLLVNLNLNFRSFLDSDDIFQPKLG